MRLHNYLPDRELVVETLQTLTEVAALMLRKKHLVF
jgi:hypothetical protein